jgi:hypothetical protein
VCEEWVDDVPGETVLACAIAAPRSRATAAAASCLCRLGFINVKSRVFCEEIEFLLCGRTEAAKRARTTLDRIVILSCGV